jgi:hypothetical protein
MRLSACNSSCLDAKSNNTVPKDVIFKPSYTSGVFCKMDGLSAAASIIAVLQITGSVIEYLNAVKDAPKECQQCTIEASHLQSLLMNLRYRLEQGQTGDPWFTAVRALSIENGPLDQYKQVLELLLSRVEIQDGVQKVKRLLLWKFKNEEVATILSRMERLKNLVNIALQMDHLSVLSQGILSLDC